MPKSKGSFPASLTYQDLSNSTHVFKINEVNDTSENSSQNFRAFYEDVGRLYPEEDLVFNSLRGRLRRDFVLRHLIGFQPPFLEIGCNRGYYVGSFKNGAALGLDVAYSVLRIAKKRFHQASWIQGDAQNLHCLRSGAVRSILCSEVLEHVPRPEQVMAQCFEVLQPGGHLLVTTPNYKKTKPTWMSVGVMEEYGVQGADGDRYFHTAFRASELRSMAQAVGFKVIECGTLEKEVKYATRIPVVFYYLFRYLNLITARNRRIDRLNDLMLERSSLLIYRLCQAVRLNDVLVRFVKEGVRSYLLARKP